jgi:CheY-like chemotaxis protein
MHIEREMAARAVSSFQGSRETILVVDDNEAVLKAVVASHEGANLRVHSADSGATALRRAEGTYGWAYIQRPFVPVKHSEAARNSTPAKDTSEKAWNPRTAVLVENKLLVCTQTGERERK